MSKADLNHLARFLASNLPAQLIFQILIAHTLSQLRCISFVGRALYKVKNERLEALLSDLTDLDTARPDTIFSGKIIPQELINNVRNNQRGAIIPQGHMGGA